MNSGRSRVSAVLIVVGLTLLFGTVVALAISINYSGWRFDYVRAARAAGGVEFCNTVGAFVIGCLGSWAFIVGVSSGLIARSQRPTILEYMQGQPVLQTLFVVFGGFIAGIFQLGQVMSFAPIQALVLGATWPSVLSQYLSGQSARTDSQTLVAALGQVSAGASSTTGASAGKLLTQSVQPSSGEARQPSPNVE